MKVWILYLAYIKLFKFFICLQDSLCYYLQGTASMDEMAKRGFMSPFELSVLPVKGFLFFKIHFDIPLALGGGTKKYRVYYSWLG